MSGDKMKERLQQELSDCVMTSSWFFCVAGVALAVPWGIRKKSYMPVVWMGLMGTLLDLINGFDKCKAQRAALESYVRNKDAFGAQATSLQVQVQRELEARQRRGGGGGSGGKGGGDVLE